MPVESVWWHSPAQPRRGPAGALRWFVVDAGAITDIDYTAALSLRELLGDLKRQQVAIIFGRVSTYLRSDMDRHGITAAVGAAHVFETLHQALAVARGGTPPIG